MHTFAWTFFTLSPSFDIWMSLLKTSRMHQIILELDFVEPKLCEFSEHFLHSKQVLLLYRDWVRPPELQCFHTLPVQRGDLSPREPERHAEALSLNWRWQLCQTWWEADGLDGIRTDEMRHKHTYTLQDRAGPQLGHCPGQTNIKFVKYFFSALMETLSVKRLEPDGSYFWTHLDLQMRYSQ